MSETRSNGAGGSLTRDSFKKLRHESEASGKTLVQLAIEKRLGRSFESAREERGQSAATPAASNQSRPAAPPPPAGHEAPPHSPPPGYPDGRLRFRNPANGYIVECSAPGLRTFLFGPLYFGIKGIWAHVFGTIFIGAMTFGISVLIYPFFARGIVRSHYLKLGWKDLSASRRPA